jgi:putative glutamine amidotransferase
MRAKLPVVGILCSRLPGGFGFEQQVPDTYVLAVRDAVGALPLLLPSLDPPTATADVLNACDGILLPGAVSNVAPHRYGAAPAGGTMLRDEPRDGIALPLVRAAIEAGRPLLGICRGLQEMNVALGGTLLQEVHRTPGRLDHRERRNVSLDEEFAPAHAVTVAEGGRLSRMLPARTFAVNSLHGQGVDSLAPGLFAEAHAPDGQVEAVSLPEAKGFVLGVQWHPEWKWRENPVSCAIFAAFAAALTLSRSGESDIAGNRFVL